MGGGGDAVPGGISGSQGPSARILHRLIQSTIARRAAKNAFLDLSDLEDKKLKVFSCNNNLQLKIIDCYNGNNSQLVRGNSSIREYRRSSLNADRSKRVS